MKKVIRYLLVFLSLTMFAQIALASEPGSTSNTGTARWNVISRMKAHHRKSEAAEKHHKCGCHHKHENQQPAQPAQPANP